MATDEAKAAYRSTLEVLYSNIIFSPKAAEELASITLASNVPRETQLRTFWEFFLDTVLQHPEHHDHLVDVLIDLSELPDAVTNTPQETNQPEPLRVHGQQVWKDLPMLSSSVAEWWDLYASVLPPDCTPSEKEGAISRELNKNRFFALLVTIDEPVFLKYAVYAIHTLREALEFHLMYRRPGELLEAWIPAAAVWIEVLGVQMYEWEGVYETREANGGRARGGSLWREGEPGFSKERWRFWRERFAQAKGMKGEPIETRRIAEEAEIMMMEIEAGHVE
ncbi:hypothetical protein BDW74DRAFT_185835 [Aspergillus multicolor]|uniref:DUF3632 domain-containing protein n=1 Tax=Aspergillus multicolor TaxID=41759 RepID=UPI003CCCF40B